MAISSWLDRAERQLLRPSRMGGTLEDACTYLVGPVLGYVLRLHGFAALHASAVLIGGRVVCFCGPAEAGKSTVAAAFGLRGHPVLAEDISALVDRGDAFSVLPGYPRVNLWPAAAEGLFGAADLLPAVTPTWEKRFLPLETSTTFHAEAAPLAAVYLLGERQPRSEPVFSSLRPAEALASLAANTYTAHLHDTGMRALEFEILGRLVKYVPVRRLLPPASLSDVGRLCDGIVGNYESMS